MSNIDGQCLPLLFSLTAVVCFDSSQSGSEAEGDVDQEGLSGEEYDSDEREKMRELISKKLKKEKGGEKADEQGEEDREKKTSRRYGAARFHSYCYLSTL